MTPAKLNLGCGHVHKQGYLNVDISEQCNPDIQHDLNCVPWPFQDNQFELVEVDHVLEHISVDLRLVIQELYRIMQNRALLIIRVPHFSRGFTHWDHKRGFDFTFKIYFDPEVSGAFEGVCFDHVSTRVSWFSQHHLKKKYLNSFAYFFGRVCGIILDFLGNINPFFTSRLLSFWVGGYEEIEFKFRKCDLPKK